MVNNLNQRKFLFILPILLGVFATHTYANCRQALVLSLDVSGSVDSQEYRLQLDGLAAALRHPDVKAALLALPSAPVRLTVFEWSAPTFQRQILQWTEVDTENTLAQIATQLETTTRSSAPPGTALGTAMQYGAALLAEQNNCWKHTLDISGDGKHNQGPHPRDVNQSLNPLSMTINALVIGADTKGLGDQRQVEVGELKSYFEAWVILGPNAFVQTALGFEEYEAAMVRKLLRELQSPILSMLSISQTNP